jgi:peroxiredoxin
VTISPQLPRFCKELVRERRLPFDVLSDRGLAVAHLFGVAFALPEKMRWVYRDVFKVDLPARFVIDQRAIIRSADASLDHTSRPEPAAMIEILKNLSQA